MRLCFAPLLLGVAVVEAKLDFLVMADWGGQETSPFTTGGELGCGVVMGNITETVDAKFALAIGDNFYSHGLPGDVTDPRFEHTFENAFRQAPLRVKDYFRVVAGNHDHIGNVTAQIEYSNVSAHWRFDSLYWSFTETIPASSPDDVDATLEVLMIDTVILSGNSDVQDENGNITHSLKGSELPGPADQDAADAQWTWLEDTLSKSTAEYLIVAGHYPVYSICEHGPTPLLITKLKPMMEKYHVNAYFAGHDHCAEHLNEGTPNAVDFHGMGATHLLDESTQHTSAVPAGSLKFHYGATAAGQTGSGFGAFARVTVDSKGMKITHISSEGVSLYTAPLLKPRTPPKPTPPSPPTPAPPAPTPVPAPPAGKKWECHTGKQINKAAVKKLNLVDDDLGDAGPKTLSACEGKCVGTANCAVAEFHEADSHCHTLSGAVTHSAFIGALVPADAYQTCMLVAA